MYVYFGFAVELIVHLSNPNLNYETVRKWTSKLDIFQKKYIIVPVNEK